jgi:aspartate-semialdehyde dehydrogenase
LAVVGATGAVGRLVVRLLEERRFPLSKIKFLASDRSAGKKIKFQAATHLVEVLQPKAFEGVDLVIGSTPDDVAQEFAPWAVAAGAIVIDESGAHRMMDNVPLVIPEVNPQTVRGNRGIIASPNCSTTQLVMCLKPLHDRARVRRVVVSTYQAASGAGAIGEVDLMQGTAAALAGKNWKYSAFKHPIAFNVIPRIGSTAREGYTSEEMKMVRETQKILEDDSIRVCATCVRVPVANCHSESIVVETERAINVSEVRDLFASAPGITVVDDLQEEQYPMPLDCHDRDGVFVGRIRRDLSCENGLAFWCVSDNLRKGAATNAVQIAELLISELSARCGISN